jgi:hypothetical protein
MTLSRIASARQRVRKLENEGKIESEHHGNVVYIAYLEEELKAAEDAEADATSLAVAVKTAVRLLRDETPEDSYREAVLVLLEAAADKHDERHGR